MSSVTVQRSLPEHREVGVIEEFSNKTYNRPICTNINRVLFFRLIQKDWSNIGRFRIENFPMSPLGQSACYPIRWVTKLFLQTATCSLQPQKYGYGTIQLRYIHAKNRRLSQGFVIKMITLISVS